MWGSSIIGFGTYHYRYPSGREGYSALASFSPRRQKLGVYPVGEFGNRHQSALARRGRTRPGRAACASSADLHDGDAPFGAGRDFGQTSDYDDSAAG